MSSRKKMPIHQATDIPGNQVSIHPPMQNQATVQSLLPALLPGSMLPANGLLVDNNAAVSYIASNRRRDLRAAKDKCEKTRKTLNERLTKANEELKEVCLVQAKKEQNSWINTLNSTFVKSNTNLHARVYMDLPTLSSSKEFTYSRCLKNGQYTNNEEETSSHYGRNNCVWGENITVKAGQSVLQVASRIKRLNDTLAEVAEIEVKIQREINELQYSAMETQAAIFKQSMQSDASGQGQKLLNTLDERLAGMNPIPDVPEIPA